MLLNLLEETRYEKVPVKIYDTDSEASLDVAKRIATIIKQVKKAIGKQATAVLGLATGVSPIKVYNELIRLHQAKKA
jgi:glucosamine-6-phosphate deaminase